MAKGSSDNGVQPSLCHAVNKPQEEWTLIPVGEYLNGYIVKSFCGKCLDVSGGHSKSGTPIIQYEVKKKVEKNQVWIIRKF